MVNGSCSANSTNLCGYTLDKNWYVDNYFFFPIYPVFSFNGPSWRSKPQISANFQFLLCFGSDCSSKYMCKVGIWPASPPTWLQQAQHPPCQSKEHRVIPVPSVPVGAGLLIQKRKKRALGIARGGLRKSSETESWTPGWIFSLSPDS